MFHQKNRIKLNREKGFTLIELLVVIAIIGFLSSVTFVSYKGAVEKAKVAKVQEELYQLNVAIIMLYQDTKMHPGHLSLSPCVQDPEVYLNSCLAGLQCTDGGFPNWIGPYFDEVPKDPWGTYYYFDSDYRCRNFVVGCEGVADNTWVRAIISLGLNRTADYDDGDNVVLILCVP